MKELTIATGNRHKTEEFRSFFGPHWILKDLSDYPEIQPTEETGSTFAENARLKALAVSQMIPGLVLADDSGLEVDALRGAPGVRSARYAGEQATDAENVSLLLSRLAAVGARGKERSARFRCVLVVARESTILHTAEGSVEGVIANEPKGDRGFGYDPIFIPGGRCATFAELGAHVKAEESHRARAFAALLAELGNYLTA